MLSYSESERAVGAPELKVALSALGVGMKRFVLFVLVALLVSAIVPFGLAAAAAQSISLVEVQRFDKPAGERSGRGIAFLEGRMFFGSRSTIYELDPGSGAVLNSFSIGGSIIALDGDDQTGALYAVGCCGSTVTVVDPDREVVTGSFQISTTNVQGLAVEDGKVYAASNDDIKVFEFDLATQQLLRTVDLRPFFRGNVQAVEVVGDSLLVNIDDAGSNLQVHEFDVASLRHVGVAYVGARAADSAFDGCFFWLDEEGVQQDSLIKLEVSGGNLSSCSEDGTTPPGWANGKKTGWDGGRPPGLTQTGKTPPGFEQGGGTSWK